MTIRIVTDSTCDLPRHLVDAYDITVVPCYINLDGKSYLDGIDINRQDFYNILNQGKVHPTTSAPGVGTFQNEYNRLVDEGADSILSIHVAQRLSNVHQAASLAALEMKNAPVTVIDSGQLSLGIGFQVLEAARLAKAGATVDQIIQQVNQLANRIYTFARLQTLEFLRRSGRLSFLQHQIASLVDIKPIMKMYRGEPKMEMVRTRRRAIEKLMELFQGMGQIEQIGFLHANVPDEMQDFIDRVKSSLSDNITILQNHITPVIGAHIGPGAVGFVCVAASELEPTHQNKISKIASTIKELAR